MSQDELGKLLGYTGSYISQIEQGKKTPSMKFLQKVSEITGLTLEDLIVNKPIEIGLKFKQIRLEKGFTVGDISDKTGIDFFRYADFEEGKIELRKDETSLIATLLDINPNQFNVNYEDIMKNVKDNLGRLPLTVEKIDLIIEYIEKNIQ